LHVLGALRPFTRSPGQYSFIGRKPSVSHDCLVCDVGWRSDSPGQEAIGHVTRVALGRTRERVVASTHKKTSVGVLHGPALLSRIPLWTQRSLLFLAVLVALGWLWIWLMGAVAGFRFDDAWITLRYAHNLAEHGIPSYNLDDRVDGYTSPAWMLLLAGLLRIGCDGTNAMLVMSRWLGFACVLGAIVWARALGATRSMSVAVAGFGTLGTTGFLVWSAPGMEMPFVSLTALLVLLVHTDSCREQLGRWWSSASATALVLSGLARPETLALAVALLAADTLVIARRPADRFRSLTPIVLAAGLLGSWWVWRWMYYGYPLPNVYYAKAPTPGLLRRGLMDARTFVTTRGVGVAPVVAMVLAVRGRARVALLGFSGWFAITLAAYTRAGGDFLGFHRYYQPLVPASFAVLAMGGSALFDRSRQRRNLYVSLLAVTLGVLLLLSSVETTRAALRDNVGDLRPSTQNTSTWEQVGLALRLHYPPGTRVAVRPAGIIPWASGFPAIDTMALNNKLVAHSNAPIRDIPGHQLEATRSQILSSEPDVIVEHPDVVPRHARCTQERPEYRRAGYTLVRLALPGGKWIVCVFERRR
jgi:arabinofuranosyltransferase